ncbi:MAG: DUF4402 domain-containing protein [Sphingomonadales bacterium]
MANRRLTVAALGCWMAASASAPSPAAAQCLLCAPTQSAAANPSQQPITISIETAIDFSKIGLVRLNQGGTAAIDAQTGQRVLSGALIDLGGLAVVGTVLVRGQPHGNVTVSFPASVQLVSMAGRSYPLENFTTTLKNNPKLDADGTLRFTFGGLLRIDGSATGTFRGSVPITVEYK